MCHMPQFSVTQQNNLANLADAESPVGVPENICHAMPLLARAPLSATMDPLGNC